MTSACASVLVSRGIWLYRSQLEKADLALVDSEVRDKSAYLLEFLQPLLFAQILRNDSNTRYPEREG